ncbi:MAG TPA: GNAT family N-acetyltransferase [Candidatus Nitrosocosmicus sp.]|nr:GNAT family N-acetyltransferase [Candidatus Nitrosocosmicus sp.]
MNISLIEPKTQEDFQKYYQLRWKVLRQPWGQPEGSEKDELEHQSIHIMACINKEVVGVGRLHFNSSQEAQIRYMAIDEKHNGKGIGSHILQKLERRAKKNKASYIVLHARETAIPFYEKNGYSILEKSHIFFGNIHHFKMIKNIISDSIKE